MKLIYVNKIDSTQKYIKELLKNNLIKPPVCVWSEYQTDGIGTRGNKWIGKKGNLFFSFSFFKEDFNYVPMQSLSIYFGFLFKKVLNNFGSKCVLKWPNDLYLEKKIGGVLTEIIDDKIICGIGLNSKFAIEGFESLDIKIKNDKILQEYFSILSKKPDWEEVIKEYEIEFEKTKRKFKIEGKLDKDGAIIKNGKKVYSKR
jgi:BirA family biotin operon repressor/biotin-[acetyl-CoA-carboxylase] ligase